VFGFLYLLVMLGIFNLIEVGFLLVGHTHEDVGWCSFFFFVSVLFLLSLNLSSLPSFRS